MTINVSHCVVPEDNPLPHRVQWYDFFVSLDGSSRYNYCHTDISVTDLPQDDGWRLDAHTIPYDATRPKPSHWLGNRWDSALRLENWCQISGLWAKAIGCWHRLTSTDRDWCLALAGSPEQAATSAWHSPRWSNVTRFHQHITFLYLKAKIFTNLESQNTKLVFDRPGAARAVL